MSFESAQRLYDLQTDENGFIEEEDFDEAFDSGSDEEIDEIERIYEDMRK
ncbi:MAG: hypothetical protein WCW68_14455 [Methanothrix sp.]